MRISHWADLHTHSVFSDGSFTPEDLVRRAAAAGLDCIALTDHDATDGIPRAVEAGRKMGLEVIPGVELSTGNPARPEEDIHVLGYFMQWDHPTLKQWLGLFRRARLERVKQILRKLAACGMRLKVDGLLEKGDRVSVGRMHVARLMLEQGHVRHLEDAFKNYLRPGRPGYVPKLAMTSIEAIRLIRLAGGVTVLAHPMFGASSVGAIQAMAKKGMAGIEVWHSHHTARQSRRLAALARRFGLVPTGGSDCHGEPGDPKADLGRVKIPYESVEELRCLARRPGVVV